MSNAISINNTVLMGRLTRDPELRYVFLSWRSHGRPPVKRKQTLSPAWHGVKKRSLYPSGFPKAHWLS